MSHPTRSEGVGYIHTHTLIYIHIYIYWRVKNWSILLEQC